MPQNSSTQESKGDPKSQNSDQGIIRDQRGQDHPKDKKRAQRTSGLKAQRDAAETQPQSPGQPARGE
jgi:hypothetical protein